MLPHSIGRLPFRLLLDEVRLDKLVKAAHEAGNVPVSWLLDTTTSVSCVVCLQGVLLMLDVSNVNSRRFSMPFQASGRGPLKFAEYTMKFVIFVMVPQEAGNFPVSLGVPPLVSSYEKLDSWLKLLHELGRPKFGLLCRVLLDPKRLQKPMQLRYSVLLQLVRRKLQEAPSE